MQNRDVIYGNAGDEKSTYACSDLYGANVLYGCLCAKTPAQGHMFWTCGRGEIRPGESKFREPNKQQREKINK